MGAVHSTPVAAQVPSLPPGYVDRTTLSTFMPMAMMQSATLALVLYDILLTLPAEFDMYRTRGFKSLVTPAFVISRYGAPASIGTTICLVSQHGWSSDGCHAIARTVVALLLILASATTVLFGVRSWAMCHRSHYVLGGVVLLTLVQLVGNIVIASWLRPYTIHGICLLDLVPAHRGQYWWFYVGSMGVPAILFLLALSSFFMDGSGQLLFSLRGQTIQRRLLRDGVIYFVCLIAVNVLNVAFILAESLSRWMAMNITLCTAITSICSSRLVLHKLSPPTNWKLRRATAARLPPVVSGPFPSRTEADLHPTSPLAFGPVTGSAPRGSASLAVQLTVETQVLCAPSDGPSSDLVSSGSDAAPRVHRDPPT